jgi:hypothetical protein
MALPPDRENTIDPSEERLDPSEQSADSPGFSAADTQPMPRHAVVGGAPEMRKSLEAQHAQAMREQRSVLETKPLRKKILSSTPKVKSRADSINPLDVVRGTRRHARGSSSS